MSATSTQHPHRMRTRPTVGWWRNRNTDQGFTLIELLVVIIIIGILAAIAIPVFLNQKRKAVDAQSKAEIHSIVMAQEAYMVDNPSDSGTSSFATLKQYGWVHQPGNKVWVYVKYGVGYYIMVRNDGDSSGGAAGWGMLYDSSQGGFMNGGKLATWSTYANTGAFPSAPSGSYAPGAGTSSMCGDAVNVCP